MRSAAASALQATAQRADRPPVIYIACPWTPAGGGMFKVADYLIQSQAQEAAAVPQAMRGLDAEPVALPCGHALLAPLDTRGSGHPARCVPVLALALARIARLRWRGQLAGVHVNMAERLSLVRKSVLVLTCRALGVPVVVHLHAAQLHRAWPQLPRPAQALVRWVFSLPECCIALGPASAQFVQQSLRVPPERVVVITNGVPAPEEPPRAACARSEGNSAVVRALFVGNLSDRKGVPQLLQALALPPLKDLPLQLTLAGGGDLDHYRAMARDLDISARVRFAGWTQQAEVSRLLQDSDLFVLPSFDEGLPLAMLEALAHGVAVVCTPVGEIPEVLRHEQEALFVPPGQAQALADALARLVREPQRRLELAQRGQALYAQRFTMRVFLEAITAVHRRYFGVAAQWRQQRGES